MKKTNAIPVFGIQTEFLEFLGRNQDDLDKKGTDRT